MNTNKPRSDEPRVNQHIRTPQIRLIDEKGQMVGVTAINEAIKMAERVGLDLVEISPTADPPVCKIMDYGKYKYEAQKKAHEARKKQKVINVKEIKLRPGIEKNDFEIKMRAVLKFIDEGDKVKITLQFRGRELSYQQLGMQVFDRVNEVLQDKVKVEQPPKKEGKQAIMIVAPK